MNIKDIERRLKTINAAVRDGDDEVAHNLEDRLRDDFIEAIKDETLETNYRNSKGVVIELDIATLAKEVLRSNKYRFRRDCV